MTLGASNLADDPSPNGTDATRFRVLAGVALAALLVTLLHSYPLTFWEHDELLFAAGVERFEPIRHHPHPPGYPAYIGLGKAVNAVVNDPFTALVVLSVLSSLAGMLALMLAFRRLLGDGELAVVGASLIYFSPAMLVVSPLPMSDPPALALLGLTLYCADRIGSSQRRTDAFLLGASASLAIGCRPQLAILVVPLIGLTLLMGRSWQRATVVGADFAVTSLCWLVPLTVATGGPAALVRYQLGQASKVALFDADLARSGRTLADVVVRFAAHPWGPKLLSAPVLLCAAIGLAAAVRRRQWRLLPATAAGGVYLAAAIKGMDPADGVRYALPAAVVTALLAARGLRALARRPTWRPLVLAAVVSYALGSIVYVSPIFIPRHTSPSPPVQAARWADQHLPANAVVMYELSLWPHAMQLFAEFRPVPSRQDFGDLTDRGDVPVWVLGDGGSVVKGAAVFSWDDSDAYRKLTRNHYRVVSLTPVPQAQRYRALSGVYLPERAPDGLAWRWLAGTAEIGLPDLDASTIVVRIGLSRDSPLEQNRVTVSAGGAEPAQGVVLRGGSIALELRPAPGPVTLRIDSASSVVPAEVPGSINRDPRQVAVMLMGVEQLP